MAGGLALGHVERVAQRADELGETDLLAVCERAFNRHALVHIPSNNLIMLAEVSRTVTPLGTC